MKKDLVNSLASKHKRVHQVPTLVEAARIELASDVVLPGLLRAQH